MKQIILALSLIYLVSCSQMPTKNKTNCGKYGDFCSVKVVDYYDGDTFFVDLPQEHHIFGDRLGVRVKGIDTPELRNRDLEAKALAYAAKAYTKETVFRAKKVDLVNCSKGKYFRIVCDVIIDRRRNLAKELMARGLAVPYDK